MTGRYGIQNSARDSQAPDSQASGKLSSWTPGFTEFSPFSLLSLSTS